MKLLSTGFIQFSTVYSAWQKLRCVTSFYINYFLTFFKQGSKLRSGTCKAIALGLSHSPIWFTSLIYKTSTQLHVSQIIFYFFLMVVNKNIQYFSTTTEYFIITLQHSNKNFRFPKCFHISFLIRTVQIWMEWVCIVCDLGYFICIFVIKKI